MTKHRALLSATFWSLVVRIGGAVASFIIGVELARRLKPQGFGVYGIVIAIALVLSVLAQFGLQTITTREISVAVARQRWGVVRGYLVTFTRAVFAISTTLAILWVAVAYLFPDTMSPQVVVPSALLVPLYALTVLVGAELRALGKLVAGQVMEVFVRPALMCVVVVSAGVLSNVMSVRFALEAQVASSCVTLFLCVIVLRSVTPRNVRLANSITPTKWIGAATTLVSFDVLRQIDVSYGILLVGIFANNSEAGYFRVAMSMIIVVATPISILNVVLAPTLAQLYDGGDTIRLQRLMSFTAATMCLVTIGILAVELFCGNGLLTTLFGAQYGPSWSPLLLLTGAQVINGFFGVGWVLLTMSGGERLLTFSLAVSITSSIVIAIPLTIADGAAGAALAAVIGALIQNLLVWRCVRKHSGLEPSVVGILRTSGPFRGRR
jgi:O-antigen/teichoic acid export membrane protein